MSAEALLSRLVKVRKTGPGRWHRQLPALAYLRECFELNEETGALTWKNRPETHFKSKQQFLRWNTRYAGRCADVNHGEGYKVLCIDYVRFRAHRVVFYLSTGIDPEEKQIDHIDCNRSNNAPSNLRLATQSQNTANYLGNRTDNTSGFRGVFWRKSHEKWEANICKNGKRIFLGHFDRVEDAAAVAASARKNVFGEFVQ